MMVTKMIISILLCFFASSAFANPKIKYKYNDEMANSACVGMSVGHNVKGFISAVRRENNFDKNCNEVCQTAIMHFGVKKILEKSHLGTSFQCFDSLDMKYKVKNSRSSKVEFLTRRMGSCTGTDNKANYSTQSIAANYCCCVWK